MAQNAVFLHFYNAGNTHLFILKTFTTQPMRKKQWNYWEKKMGSGLPASIYEQISKNNQIWSSNLMMSQQYSSWQPLFPMELR